MKRHEDALRLTQIVAKYSVQYPAGAECKSLPKENTLPRKEKRDPSQYRTNLKVPPCRGGEIERGGGNDSPLSKNNGLGRRQAALSAKAVLTTTKEFHTARHTLYSAEENMEIDKVVPVAASVKTKLGKTGSAED